MTLQKPILGRDDARVRLFQMWLSDGLHPNVDFRSKDCNLGTLSHLCLHQPSQLSTARHQEIWGTVKSLCLREGVTAEECYGHVPTTIKRLGIVFYAFLQAAEDWELRLPSHGGHFLADKHAQRSLAATGRLHWLDRIGNSPANLQHVFADLRTTQYQQGILPDTVDVEIAHVDPAYIWLRYSAKAVFEQLPATEAAKVKAMALAAKADGRVLEMHTPAGEDSQNWLISQDGKRYVVVVPPADSESWYRIDVSDDCETIAAAYAEIHRQ